MSIIQIYKCLGDEVRLRILNLLEQGPLCVCHLMEILEEDQVKISKQLAYMKENGLLESERHAQWMIYSLAERDHPLLVSNLECLREIAGEELSFEEDLRQRKAIIARLTECGQACPPVVINGTACCA